MTNMSIQPLWLTQYIENLLVLEFQITKISTNMNGTLFFINRNRIRNPSGIRNGVYETFFTQFLDISFDNGSL